MRVRWSLGLCIALVALNGQAVVQAAMFVDPSLPIAWEIGRIAESALRVIGWACVFAVIVGALPERARRIAAYAILGASVVLFGIDGFTLVHYHTVLDAGLLEIVFATNPAEAWEYVTSQAGGIAAAAGVLGTAIALGVFGRSWLQRAKRLPRWGRCALAILFLFFLASLAHAAADFDDTLENALRTNSLLRLACNTRQAYTEIGSAEYVAYTLANHDVSRTEGTSEIPYVVFILGESTSRHHMELYGYGLPTTPRLSHRDAAGELVVYEDVTSPHAGTMAVMRTLFSFYDNEVEKAAGGMWYDYGNLFDILRAAGVRTAWLSNQEASGFYGSIGRTLGERTDHVAFTSPVAHSIDLTERYDGEVLPLLDAALADAALTPPAFFVVHLMGAHEEFSKRYPKEYAQFTAEDERGRGVAEDDAALGVRAAYDNAVLYDDAIVDDIIRRFEEKDALVIFISDHGEEVYDTRAQFGHGDETSPWQRDVPMVFWMSQAFRATHTDLAGRIEAAREKHWQSDEMIHTLLDIMNIRVPEFEEKKSLLTRSGQAER